MDLRGVVRRIVSTVVADRILDKIEKMIGFPLAVEVSPDGIKISNENPYIYFRASEVGVSEELDESCKGKVWVVRGALLPRGLRNKGIGVLMYKLMMKAAESEGATLKPMSCVRGGVTSPDAQRVWDSIKRVGN